MKKRRFGVLVVLLSLFAGLTIGCQPRFQPGSYTDDAGRTVKIDKIPQRIVTFGPSITETLFALGLGEKVVGVDNFSDFPEEAKSKPKIGDFFTTSMEKIVALEPDLVLTLKHQQLNAELDARGIKFMIIDPKDIDGIMTNIELLGKITGSEGEARKLVNDMKSDISRMVDKVKGAPRVRVFDVIDATDLNNPWTAGAGSFIDALITMTGGENVAAKTSGGAWLQFSMEQVVSADPEIILLPDKYGTTTPEVLKKHPAWREITAVKQDRVYFIHTDLVDRPGPRIVRGLEEIAKIIHPELFK